MPWISEGRLPQLKAEVTGGGRRRVTRHKVPIYIIHSIYLSIVDSTEYCACLEVGEFMIMKWIVRAQIAIDVSNRTTAARELYGP